jgi:hypothetical protein
MAQYSAFGRGFCNLWAALGGAITIGGSALSLGASFLIRAGIGLALNALAPKPKIPALPQAPNLQTQQRIPSNRFWPCAGVIKLFTEKRGKAALGCLMGQQGQIIGFCIAS